MRGSTVIEVRGLDIEKVVDILATQGVEVVSCYPTPRNGWIAYKVRLPEEKFKIVPLEGYTFLGMNFSKGKLRATAKWRAIHPQVFPATIYKAPLHTINLTTEVWYDVMKELLEARASCIKVYRRQFSSLRRFEKYCNDRGIWRIIQAERGLNK